MNKRQSFQAHRFSTGCAGLKISGELFRNVSWMFGTWSFRWKHGVESTWGAWNNSLAIHSACARGQSFHAPSCSERLIGLLPAKNNYCNFHRERSQWAFKNKRHIMHLQFSMIWW